MVKKRRKGSSSSSSTQKPQLSRSTSKLTNPDLISDLPDSLLLHILTLLEMDQVIKTSLLSRRWRYLWKSIPCLLFPFYTANFIDKCLFHHEDSTVQKLHIIFDYEEEDKPALLVDTWLHFAIKCKVEDFKLDLFNEGAFDDDIQYDQFYTLPHSFYLLCTTLTSLTLRGCNLNLPDSFQLGSLKKLSLDMIELKPDSIEHFSSSCPSLEDIYLEDCNREISDLNIVITNEHVERLEISRYGQYESCKLKINAPTLLSLRIYHWYPTARFHVENLASLMSVDLIGEDSLVSFCEDVYFKPDSNINCFEKLLYDLRHVKHLKLCNRCLKVLSLMELMSSDIFSISATSLELKASFKKWELPGIRYLLENCSNIEKLKIVNGTCYEEIMLTDELIVEHNFEEEEYWASFETDVPSIMQNIMTIEIDLRDKSRYEEFVRFLLKNAKILESIMVNTPKKYDKYNYERLFKLSQRLHAFPRLHLFEDIKHVLMTIHFGVLMKL